jgi:hypothetical protein
MPKNALIKTNPYLKNAAERDASITASVVTSSAIEGVHLKPKKTRISSQRRPACQK